MTRLWHRLRKAAPLAVLALLASGCGVEPTEIRSAGPAPVIRARSAIMTVYLLRDGRLTPKNVVAASSAIEDVVEALFEAGERATGGLTTALGSVELEQTQVTTYGTAPGARNDPEGPVGQRVHVIVTSPRRLSEAAKAQITCTVMLQQLIRQQIWAVKITQTTPDGPVSLGEHTCRKYWALADDNVQLPP